MADLNEIREQAKQRKEVAHQKIQMARHQAQASKALKKNPPPQYFQEPAVTGNAETDSEAELDAVQAGFRQRARDEGKRFELATDSEYWACICFQTREQKEAFLSALKLLPFGDKYLDGQLVADQLGVKLPPADVPYNTSIKHDRTFEEFVG